MSLGIAVSGMGRIGRLVVRQLCDVSRRGFKPLMINCIYPVETVAHLLKYDTVHGRWDADISVNHGMLVINGHKIHVTFERDPANISWGSLGVQLVVDATGKFNDRDRANLCIFHQEHLMY